MHPSTELRIAAVIDALERGIGKPFKSCIALAAAVADLLQTDERKAREALGLIAAVYENPQDKSIALAIENSFLFQLGNRIFSRPDSQHFLNLLPASLHDALMRQMLSTGL